MLSFLNKLPKISLWVLFGISIVILGLFFFGGSQQVDIAGEMWDQPTYTNSLIFWTYGLLGLTVLLTLTMVLVKFFAGFKANPKKAVRTLIVLALFVGLFVIAWFLGDGKNALNIPGYTGTDNVGFWAQYTDMCCFMIYIMIALTILTMAGSYVFAKVRKK